MGPGYVAEASSRDDNNTDYVTAAYEAATGARLWMRRYNGPGEPNNGNDSPVAIALSPDGSRVAVTGGSYSIQSYVDYATVAYDTATGAQLWLRRYDSPNSTVDIDQAQDLAVSPDGTKVFVTGRSSGSGGGPFAYDYLTIAYDFESGSQRWVQRFNGPSNLDDLAYSVAVSPGGSKVFVTGWSAGDATGYDFATVAYDSSTGAKLWVRQYNDPENDDDQAWSIAASPGGGQVFVSGWSTFGYATVAYSASTGAQLWAVPDGGISVAVSPGGSKVFATGSDIGTNGDNDYVTFAYNALTGTHLWAATYQGPGSPGHGSDFGESVAASPGGAKVFVSGWSTGISTGYDYATVAYSASTGQALWVERYDGPGNDDEHVYTSSLAVSPGGTRVFVTGESTGAGTDDDFATVAYAA